MTVSATFLAVALATTLSLTSCTPASETTTWAGTIEERDGVTWVTNPADGLWAGRQTADGAPAGFRLELEQVFGADMQPEDAILGFPGGVAVDGPGNVYVVDRQANEVVSFAPDGEVRWRVGGTGEGPGEINFANGIAWDGADRLYMDNQGATQIDVRDLDGNFLATHRLPLIDISRGYVGGLLDTQTLALWQADLRVPGSSLVVVSVEADPWIKGAEFVAGAEPELGDEERYRRDVDVRPAAGRIWAGNRLTYRLEEYDPSGTLLRVITRDAPDLVPAIVTGGTGYSFGEFQAPMQLPDGHLLVPRYRVTNFETVDEFRSLLERIRAGADEELTVFDSAFDLLDSEGRYLATLESEGMFGETGWTETVGPDGRLYTVAREPFPQVRRYRIVIDAP